MTKLMKLENAALPQIRFETVGTLEESESTEFEIETGWQPEDAESFFQEAWREEQAFNQGRRPNCPSTLVVEEQLDDDSGWTLAAIAEIRREMRLFPGRP